MTEAPTTSSTPDTSETAEARIAEQIAAAEAELVAFHNATRKVILAQHTKRNWCQPGTDDVLNDLGLPPMKYSYIGTVPLDVNVTVEGAANKNEATQLLIDRLTATSTDKATVTVHDFSLPHYAADRISPAEPR
jgi:hypothetical protein